MDEGDTLVRLLKAHAADPSVLDNLLSTSDSEEGVMTIVSSGQQAVNEIFGLSAARIGSGLASFVGIKRSSAGTLLAISMAFVLGFLRR